MQNDIFVPVSTPLETDLLLKVSGYTDGEREVSWGAIDSKITAESPFKLYLVYTTCR